MIGREDEVRTYRDRAAIFNFFVAGAILLILSRVFYLQIMRGEELRRFSDSNRLKKEKIMPTRGVVFDRNGKVVVDNRAAFDVVLSSQYYSFEDDLNERLAKALRLTPEEFNKKLTRVQRTPSFYPILLRADVDKDIIAAIEMDAEGFPGVDVEATVQRRYPQGDAAAQLLGYIGEVDPKDVKNDPKKELQPGDYIGKMGIERVYDPFIRGQNGVGYMEVDAMGRRKKSEGAERVLGFVSHQDPIPGSDLYLTLDVDLEAAASQSMKQRKFHGSVIAMDPRNGEILALLNDPSYDPGLISGREINQKVWADLSTNKERPLRNRAIQDHYPPGSTFKLFLAIAGLAEGVISTKSSVNCAGSIPFGSRRFNCWKKHGHVDFFRSIRESCDIFYYNLGNHLGVDTIAKYARLFGFGERTGLKIGDEARGLIPDTTWKKKRFNDVWHAGETLSVAIGQGYVDVTPIQLATAYAAIANGGFVYRPFLVRRIEKRGGEVIKEFQPELIRKIEIPAEVFEAVKEGLFQVANVPGGTAYHAGRSKITQISGKTGTAQVRAFADIKKVKCEESPVDYRHHGLFVGYAPRENPQIVVATVAEHSCHGTAAAPIVRDVIEAYIRKQAILAGKPIPDDFNIMEASIGVAKKKKKKEEPPPEETESLPEPPTEDANGKPEVPPAAGDPKGD